MRLCPAQLEEGAVTPEAPFSIASGRRRWVGANSEQVAMPMPTPARTNAQSKTQ